MLRKAFQVQVEIEIQAVSCPGVWLCPNGKVSLQVYLLGSCIQTSSMEPVFPLNYQEKFIFYKTFFTVQKLNELQKVLNKEIIYAELIQWQDCEIGNVLATFQTTLTDLLFPCKRQGTMAGADVDLLMEPMKNFPGILAPKIEVSTKTVIEDKVCANTGECSSYVINPKVLTSKPFDSQAHVLRQRRVCHSAKYHKGIKCTQNCQEILQRPPFVFKRVDENLLSRKYDSVDEVYCHCKKSPTRGDADIRRKANQRSKSIERCSQKSIACVQKGKRCNCSDMHNQSNCPVCAKYTSYFESQVPSIKSKKHSPRVQPHRSMQCTCGDIVDNSNKLCNYPPRNSKPSIADKIHNRLSETLNYYESLCLDNCSSSMRPQCDCDCLSCDDNCSLSSFGHFYKKLYEKTKDKCEKYISCN